MLWDQFLAGINPAHISRQYSTNTISGALGDGANVGYCGMRRNVWYPGGYEGVTNGVVFRGCRYVDMDYSYAGTDDAFCSEANHCAILILIDPASANRFLAHLSAASDITLMQPNLRIFLQSVGNDINRPRLYIFRGSDPRIDELDLTMELLSSCISDVGLSNLAGRSYFIEGEGNSSWRAHSSVYSKYRAGAHMLNVMFARAA